jgi:hypothetical protein
MQSVEITWLDAKVSVEGGLPDLPLMTSIGVVIHKDKLKTCVCSLFGPGGDPRIVTSIPTCLIKSVNKKKVR